jgi:SAM-dependent methyltransferase
MVKTCTSGPAGVRPGSPLPYPAALVIAANRAYHDAEGAAYAGRHPEIFNEEAARWRGKAERFLTRAPAPLRILDIGSGTGFVPSVIAPLLASGDVVTCSDIAAAMLDVCRAELAARPYPCRFRFQILDGSTLPFEDGSFDAVTMNSVAHHIPRLEEFWAEAARVVCAGGRMFIGHEPNRRFYATGGLRRLSVCCETIFRPRVAAARLMKTPGIDALLRLLRIRRLLTRFSKRMNRTRRRHQEVLDAVNRQLLVEGAVREPLTAEQIVEIVDIHSPNAGPRVAPERGFDVEELVARHLPGFEVEDGETYNHLGNASAINGLTRRLDRSLRRRLPERGATLFVVLRKIAR